LRNKDENSLLYIGKNTVTRRAIKIRMAEPVEGDENYEWRRDLYA